MNSDAEQTTPITSLYTQAHAPRPAYPLTFAPLARHLDDPAGGIGACGGALDGRAQVRYALPSAEVCSAARHAAPMSHQKGSDHVSQGKHCALCVHEVTSAGLPRHCKRSPCDWIWG